MRRKHSLAALAVPLGLAVLASCGSSTPSSEAATTPSASVVAESVERSYELLGPAAADALLRDPPSGLVVLDVRTPEEFAAGHIAGAVELDLQGETFETEAAELDPTAPYFVYCQSGNRSGQAVAYLQAHGFNSIYELEGGIGAWQAAGLAVVGA
jgi:phage shock protein E